MAEHSYVFVDPKTNRKIRIVSSSRFTSQELDRIAEKELFLRPKAEEVALKYGLPVSLFDKQIEMESGWNPKAKSRAGALGIAQFMPQTAKAVGLKDPFDPEEALEAAGRHMKTLLENFGGDYAKALAAYNAGGGRVKRAEKYGENWLDHLPRETRNYVMNIMGSDRGGRAQVGQERKTGEVSPEAEAAHRGAVIRTTLAGHQARLRKIEERKKELGTALAALEEAARLPGTDLQAITLKKRPLLEERAKLEEEEAKIEKDIQRQIAKTQKGGIAPAGEIQVAKKEAKLYAEARKNRAKLEKEAEKAYPWIPQASVNRDIASMIETRRKKYIEERLPEEHKWILGKHEAEVEEEVRRSTPLTPIQEILKYPAAFAPIASFGIFGVDTTTGAGEYTSPLAEHLAYGVPETFKKLKQAGASTEDAIATILVDELRNFALFGQVAPLEEVAKHGEMGAIRKMWASLPPEQKIAQAAMLGLGVLSALHYTRPLTSFVKSKIVQGLERAGFEKSEALETVAEIERRQKETPSPVPPPTKEPGVPETPPSVSSLAETAPTKTPSLKEPPPVLLDEPPKEPPPTEPKPKKPPPPEPRPEVVLSEEEIEKRIEAVEKVARGTGVPVFEAPLRPGVRGEYRYQLETFPEGKIKINVEDRKQYLSTLTHETAHAIDAYLSTKAKEGTTLPENVKLLSEREQKIIRLSAPSPKQTLGDWGALFGISEEAELRKLRGQLKKVTEELVGIENVKQNPRYYYDKRELWARFVESVVLHPDIVSKHAPDALAALRKQAQKHKIIDDLLRAAMGKSIEHSPGLMFLPDERQTLIKKYGRYLGTGMLNDVYVYTVRTMESLRNEMEKLLEENFKNIKDPPDLLFKAAAAIKENKGGKIVFGTKDKIRLSKKEIQKLHEEWKEKVERGEDVPPWEDFLEERSTKVRYTPEEGEAFWNQLSPEGKKLIDRYTRDITEATDLFNRNLFREIYKIEDLIEGYIHQIADIQKTKGEGAYLKTERMPFKNLVSSIRRLRKGYPNIIEDFMKAVQKGYTEEVQLSVWNKFVNHATAIVAEPLKKGEEPAKGYIRVWGNAKSGFFLEKPEGKRGYMPQWQVPKWFYENFLDKKAFFKEEEIFMKPLREFLKFSVGNLLLHPGTALWNVLSGSIQLTTKFINDFYLDLFDVAVSLSGGKTPSKFKMHRTASNIAGFIEAFVPETLRARMGFGVPEWTYGGAKNTYVGLVSDFKPSLIDNYLQAGLFPFLTIERFYKRAIMLMEKQRLTFEKGKKLEWEDIVAEATRAMDIHAYDYENVPGWLKRFRKNPLGNSIKPFITYPYKSIKQMLYYMGGFFDPNRPWNERLASLFTVATMVALLKLRKDSEDWVSESLKKEAEKQGVIKVGDYYMRVNQLPFLNAYETINLALSGAKTEDVLESATENLFGSGLGPLGNAILYTLGYSSKYNRYQPLGGKLGETVGISLIPFSRIFRDINEYLSGTKSRQPKTFAEGFMRYVPGSKVVPPKKSGKIVFDAKDRLWKIFGIPLLEPRIR